MEGLVKGLSNPTLLSSEVITWACPVPYFGDLLNSRIATVGINPSNLEFVDAKGNELTFAERRFPTLKSLKINDWSAASMAHISEIEEACKYYFARNPYDNWFKRLDFLISGTSSSYYFPASNACHLDLVPYVTSLKWSALSSIQQSSLLEVSAGIIGELLKNSSVEILVLNGKTVIQTLQKISGAKFNCVPMQSWLLPRKSKEGIMGYAYEGSINMLGNVALGRNIRILGYNHNIQSSFGITSYVQNQIRNWISETSKV